LHAAIDERRRFVDLVGKACEPAIVTRACRDPRDDKSLELAVAGGADVIVTGDGDLLAIRSVRLRSLGFHVKKHSDFDSKCR